MIDRNGFSFPLHPYQILSWAIYAFHIIFPVFSIIPPLNPRFFLVFIILFYGTQGLVLIIGYLSTKSNPTITLSKDPLYLETSENINFYCTICNSYVTRTAKHCGTCDRCVDRFDHHCKWLNNCIGGENYKLFINLLLTVYTSEIILLSFEIKFLTLNPPKDPIFGFIIFDCILNILITFLLTYLIGVHIMLKFKGMTTYEYIKAARKKKEMKIKPETKHEINEENKDLNKIDEVKRSIIKAGNYSLVENPISFSVPKASVDDLVHLTMQLPLEFDTDRSLTN